MWLKKHKILTCVSVMVLLAAGISSSVLLWLNANHKAPEKETTEAEYTFYQIGTHDLGNYDDVGVMIADCDDETEFVDITGATVTRRSGKYVQGTGALSITSLLSNGSVYGKFEEKDISAYADGSVHISLYIRDPGCLGDQVVFELTSSGIYDVDEVCWLIPKEILKAGWNELYLGFEDTIVEGKPDLTKINFFRMFSLEGKTGLEVVIDNIYASATPGMSLEVPAESVKTASTKEGLLMDCDTLDGVASTGMLSLSIAKGEYKEGTGAIIISNPDTDWITANLKKIDLSSYEGGKLSFWVFVNDASYIKKGEFCLELTSSGTFDDEEMCWSMSCADWKTGWNQIVLDFPSQDRTGNPVDLTRINFLRMFATNCDKDLVLILDEVAVEPPARRTPADGLILSCDTTEAMIVESQNTFSLTNTTGEYKQGTGSFKSIGAGTVWWMVRMEELVDVSEFADGGISLWLYVNDPTQLKSPVAIELGSGGVCDVDEYQWEVAGLRKGWNQLALRFANAKISGNPDLKNVNYFRIYAEMQGTVTAILDDVRAAHIAEKAALPGMILDCDNLDNVKELYGDSSIILTGEENEYKQGDGAFKSVGKGQVRYRAILAKALDLTAYKDGALSFWLYVGDTSEFASPTIFVEITSAGEPDKEELGWTVSISDLKANSWNEVKLNFADAGKTGGDINFASVNFFRIYTDKAETSENVLMILDDVHAEKTPTKHPDRDDSKTDTDEEKVPGLILSCDHSNNMIVGTDNDWSITTAEGEYKEGTGAFKSEGSCGVFWQVLFTKTVDVSEYANGRLHLWLYVSDTSKTGQNIYVELGSAGAEQYSDAYEYQWEIPSAKLESGQWNELYLKLKDASAMDGGADLSKVNWLRIYAPDCMGNIITMMDDVRMVQPEENASNGVILSCDNQDNIAEVGTGNTWSITTATGEYKEGTGAFKSVGTQVLYWHTLLKNTIDITGYANGGLHLWLYISDTSRSGEIHVELGSGGSVAYADKNEYEWTIPSASLKNGQWNELYLPFADADVKDGKPDLSKINWFRVFAPCCNGQEVTAIVDDVRVEVKGGSVTPGMILNCDNEEGVSVGTENTWSITNVSGEYKEGNGAFKSVGTKVLYWASLLKETKDITAYEKGGLHLWLYVSDTSRSGEIHVELGSGGVFPYTDKNEYEWTVPSTSLTSGQWNELYLPFSDAEVKDGQLDLSKINWFRVFAPCCNGQEVTAMVDDVRVEIVTPGMILNCDSKKEASIGSGNTWGITTAPGEYKEGIGAFKSVGTNVLYWQALLDDTIDVKEYAGGGLHIWLYVSDTARSGEIHVELGSGGKLPYADENEYEWTIPSANLTSGEWNELYLPFSDADVEDGEPDLSKINWFRVFAPCCNGQEVTAMVDDVRVMTNKVSILSCDLASDVYETVQVTTAEGTFKEGTGAYISSGTSQVRWQVSMKKSVDISSCQKLNMWLYISDVSKLNSDVHIEIGSNGTCDDCELEWKITDHNLVNGWNKVELVLSEGADGPVGKINLSKVNYFRIYQETNSITEDVVMIVDDICAVLQ